MGQGQGAQGAGRTGETVWRGRAEAGLIESASEQLLRHFYRPRSKSGKWVQYTNRFNTVH
jgi:hypothetical protein